MILFGDVHITRERVVAETKQQKVSVVGVGYVGLPLALLIANSGFSTLGYDIDESKLDLLRNGTPHISERGLSFLLNSALVKGSLSFSSTLKPADVYVIAVPTPFIEESKAADLSYVWKALDDVAEHLVPGNMVLIESTVPLDTSVKAVKYLADKTGLQAGADYAFAHCPERVLPGDSLREVVYNDRVIGGYTQECTAQAIKFYSAFTKGELHGTSARAAEVIKLVENSSRDVQIAFSNQVESMCHQANLDSSEVLTLASKHPRVNLLRSGCGVGGHCIAVDPFFLIEKFPQHTQLLQAARSINEQRPFEVVDRILARKETIEQKERVVVLGAAYKPGVDDIRNSPALIVAGELCKKLGKNRVVVVDPHVNGKVLKEKGFAVASLDSIGSNDYLVALVKHHEFLQIIPRIREGSLEMIDFCGLTCDRCWRESESKKALFAQSDIEVSRLS